MGGRFDLRPYQNFSLIFHWAQAAPTRYPGIGIEATDSMYGNISNISASLLPVYPSSVGAVDGSKVSSRRAATTWSISRHLSSWRRRHGNLSAAAADFDDEFDMDDDDGLSCVSLPADVKPPNFFLATVSRES